MHASLTIDALLTNDPFLISQVKNSDKEKIFQLPAVVAVVVAVEVEGKKVAVVAEEEVVMLVVVVG